MKKYKIILKERKYSLIWFKTRLQKFYDKIEFLKTIYNDNPKECKVLLQYYGERFDSLRNEALEIGYMKKDLEIKELTNSRR